MCLGRLGTQRRRAVHQLAPLLDGALQNLKYLEAKIWMNHGRRRMGMEGRVAQIASGRSRLLGFGGKGILFFLSGWMSTVNLDGQTTEGKPGQAIWRIGLN